MPPARFRSRHLRRNAAGPQRQCRPVPTAAWGTEGLRRHSPSRHRGTDRLSPDARHPNLDRRCASHDPYGLARALRSVLFRLRAILGSRSGQQRGPRCLSPASTPSGRRSSASAPSAQAAVSVCALGLMMPTSFVLTYRRVERASSTCDKSVVMNWHEHGSFCLSHFPKQPVRLRPKGRHAKRRPVPRGTDRPPSDLDLSGGVRQPARQFRSRSRLRSGPQFHPRPAPQMNRSA